MEEVHSIYLKIWYNGYTYAWAVWGFLSMYLWQAGFIESLLGCIKDHYGRS